MGNVDYMIWQIKLLLPGPITLVSLTRLVWFPFHIRVSLTLQPVHNYLVNLYGISCSQPNIVNTRSLLKTAPYVLCNGEDRHNVLYNNGIM